MSSLLPLPFYMSFFFFFSSSFFSILVRMERVWCLVACVHRIGSPIDDSLLVGAVEWNLWTLDAHSLARVMITRDVFHLSFVCSHRLRIELVLILVDWCPWLVLQNGFYSQHVETAGTMVSLALHTHTKWS